ncbi:hypothetical protein BDW60DRAFT_183376 [Aspergillus nidulans var. acristatus]
MWKPKSAWRKSRTELRRNWWDKVLQTQYLPCSAVMHISCSLFGVGTIELSRIVNHTPEHRSRLRTGSGPALVRSFTEYSGPNHIATSAPICDFCQGTQCRAAWRFDPCARFQSARFFFYEN